MRRSRGDGEVVDRVDPEFAGLGLAFGVDTVRETVELFST